jgi:hypothetical protein
MNIIEFYQSIPLELHGNIAVSAMAITITGKDGKAQAWEMGGDVEGQPVEGQPVEGKLTAKAKEVKNIKNEDIIKYAISGSEISLP